MKTILKFTFLCLGTFSFFSQEIKEYNDGVIKITYLKGRTSSPEYNTDVFLYTNEHQSEYHFHQTERTFPVDWYEVTLAYWKYINKYDFKTNKVEENRILKDNTNLFSQWENDLVWEITDEEKMIGEYRVRKATTDSFEFAKEDEWHKGKAIAWFTTDIPIPTGPRRYYGLPGLILELTYDDSKDFFTFKSLEYLSPSEFQFTELNKDNEVEKEDVIYFFHKNPKKIKEIQRNNRKKK